MRGLNIVVSLALLSWSATAMCIGVAASLTGAAVAQSRGQRFRCHEPEFPDLAIAACTAELQLEERTANRAQDLGSRGLAYFFKGQYDLAIRDFDEALRLHPNTYKARQRRGNAKLAQGDIAGATADLGPTVSLPDLQIRRPVRTMRLPCGQDCGYHGEVKRDSGIRSDCGAWPRCPYCSGGYCAHGYGWLGNDWSVELEGNFADGLPNGHGQLSTDFIEYAGGFRYGMPYGRGILTCVEGGARFDLVDGRDIRSGVSLLPRVLFRGLPLCSEASPPRHGSQRPTGQYIWLPYWILRSLGR